MPKADKPQFKTYTFIGKRHGLTVSKLKQVLAAAGYLLDDQPTPKALEAHVAKMVPFDPEQDKFGTGRTEFAVWNLDLVEALIQEMGVSRDPRGVPRGTWDMSRCTGAYVKCVTTAVGAKGWHDEAPLAPRSLSEIKSELGRLDFDSFVDMAGNRPDRIVHCLLVCDAWLTRRRKIIDQKAFDDALIISKGIRGYLEKWRGPA